jgi:signal peptidase I
VLRRQEELLTGTLVADVLREHGAVRFRALGGSMFPTLISGDVLSIEACAADVVEIGDIVVMCEADRVFAHRLVDKQLERNEPFVITRGDAHWQNDPPRPASVVVGRVVGVARNGRVLRAPFGSTVRHRAYGLFVNESTRLVRRARQQARAIFAL